ncbi:MAG: hypothetical protein ACFFEN_00815 [Candidatus Thorarchaeota archaeon]
MLFEKSPKKIKKILLVVMFLMSIIAILISIFIQEIPGLSSLFNNYIDSGESFFIPIIPYINLLGFIPEEHQIAQLSLGQLIDILIIIGIVSSTERGIYQYYTRICLSEDNLLFNNVGSYFYEPKENLLSSSENYIIYFRQEIDSLEDLERMKDLEKFRIKFNSYEKINIFFDYLRRNKYHIRSMKFYKRFTSFFKTRYIHIRIFCYRIACERFLLSSYKHSNQHPKINSLTNSQKTYQQEGCK